ncbi:restriction endonuclease subunit S [Olleya sp. YSTF-M6]|uniref:Restriction endonuclease subunit S n=1 Tax=Olleya sediminilitoris TaxID=2795739 RepID=A0ABS1WIM5_9FLAO|nr:restriction endonuclease subunit S [Olleya sediminilitoris]MBL7558975.1 restriction endonuclease subunit S [Olleya sediminilitoris]
MYGLEQEDIDKINSVFSKYPEVEKAILYGSRAKGNYKPHSDIDITLVGKTLTLSQQFSIETDLDDLLLPYKMDISIFHKIENEDLINHIIRVGISLYNRINVLEKINKNNWKEERLGDVIYTNENNISKGFPHKDIKYLDTGSITENKIEGYQFFKLDEAPSRAKRLVNDEDIIYSTVRPIQLHYGFIKNPDENLVVSTGFTVIRCDKDRIYPKFLYHYLTDSNQTEYLHSIAEGSTSTYPSLKPSDIEALEIKLPPLPEQKAIANALSSLENKIALLHRQNKTLEALSKVLFRQFFIEEANEEWEEESLSSVAYFLNGLACQKFPPKNEIDKLPVLKIKDLKSGISDSSDFASTDVNEKYFVKNGDVIFSWSASLVVKIWDGEDCILNQHLFKVTSERFPKWFYYLWSKYHLDMFIAIAKAHATTMGHIKRGDLDDAMVIIPPPSELAKMSKTFTPLIDKIIANNQQIKQVEKLRDTLLPKLMSGEVRVQL